MYVPFYGLRQKPFSIAPDPRYLFMSERHREALAHLLYGVQGGGGFVLLTGEIGAGKTTVCRCFLEQIPTRCNVAYIFNPKLTVLELLTTVCHEFGIQVPRVTAAGSESTVKDYVDALNHYLLRTHSVNQNNVLIIDEAQNLSADVLEQLRLLTNLETNERKLLQIMLIGQPELRDMLARPDLEQLAQRVIARYHLDAMTEQETGQYIAHRLAVAGFKGALPFDVAAMHRIHELTRGVPRRVNLLCDRALLGGYARGKTRVDRSIVEHAALEVFGPRALAGRTRLRLLPFALGAGVLVGAVAMATAHWSSHARSHRAAIASAAFGSTADAGLGGSPRPTAPATNAPPTVSAPASAALASSSLASSAMAAASVPSASPKAAPATVPRLRTIEEVDALLARAPPDEREPLRQIAPAWQVEPGAAAPCEAAAAQGLGCFHAHGGLALLRLLARPSVLALRDAQDRPVYAALAALGRDDATLLVGGEPHDVPLALLATAWRGDFTTLWHVPPGYAEPLRLGAQGPQVDRLAIQLVALQGGLPPALSHPFDETLKARVSAFQQAQGLSHDGVAGPTTLMQLARAAGVAEPWLAGIGPVTGAAATTSSSSTPRTPAPTLPSTAAPARAVPTAAPALAATP